MRRLDLAVAATAIVALAVTGGPVALVPAVIMGASLAWGRTAPIAAYAAGTLALAAEALWITPGALSPIVNLAGLYLTGRYATARRAPLGPLIMLPGVAAYFAGEPELTSPVLPAVVVVAWLAAWTAGYTEARRRDRQESDRRLMHREAVTDERHRIARELHDLLGHTMSVMLVQTGAARTVLDSDPDRARELLTGAETAGRDALDELDRVLSALRENDAQPGLAGLPTLRARMRDAGLDVTLRIEPEQPALPGSLDLSAYRIVQEALTNALRHGRATTAAVSVRCDTSRVLVEVSDDGRGPQPGYAAGRGLLGIAERAAVFGGAATHGRDASGGFRVRAELPLPVA
jgi:signal transduction histidine kinase